jgi:hypothetical protein
MLQNAAHCLRTRLVLMARSSRVWTGFSRLSVEFRSSYPKVSGLAAWSENSEWYSSLPLGAVVLLFC